MNIDSFLKIGHSHTMCQDYIISGTSPMPYIILADGCSSAKNSDIGARLLCHSALSMLTSLYNSKNNNMLDIGWSIFGNTVIVDAKLTLHNSFPSLDTECLDATLIVAYKTKGVYKIVMYGDGHIYVTNKDNSVAYHKISFEPNAPSYLRYWIKGQEEYLSNKIMVTHESQHGINGKISTEYGIPCIIDVKEQDVKSLVIASDGVDSIMFKEETMYKTKYLDLYGAVLHNKSTINPHTATKLPQCKEKSFLEVLNDVTQFKLTDGPFLSRRIKKVLKGYEKEGFVNDDDISIGCFYEG